MLQELRVAGRSLRRTPWYAVTVMLVLAAGIALPTVTFAIVDGVLFKPLPYPDAHELYLIRADTTGDPQEAPPPVSWTEIEAWRAAVPDVAIGVAGAGAARVEQAARRDRYSASVDEHFLDVLGVRPLVGGFSLEDHRTRRESGDFEITTLLSFSFWQAAHSADRGRVGRSVVVREVYDRRVSVRVAGVLPPDFVFPAIGDQPQPDELTPLGAPQDVRYQDSAQARTLRAFVRIDDPSEVPRLRDRLLDATRELARQARPEALHGRTLELSPPFDRIALVPLADYLGREERPAFVVALSAAGLLLLLACLNVAGLAAARTVERQRDLAVRRALGADRWALVRGHLAELALLMLPACALGLAATRPLLVFTVDLLPASLTLLKTPIVDARVFAAAVVLGFLSLLVIVMWPARAAGRVSLLPALGRSTSGGSRRIRSGHWLIAAQTAAGFVLMTAAGLTGASLAAAWTEDTGYDRSRLTLLEGYASFYDSQQESSDQLFDTWRLLRRVPGVEDAAVASIQPLFESAASRPYTNWIPQAGAGDIANVSSRLVSSNYFQVMGLDLVEGSWPDPAVWDADGPTAVVSESAARLWWPDRSAVGQVLVIASERLRTVTPPKVVVGVVRDARYSALDLDPIRDVYVPNPIQLATYGVFFLARTSRPVDDVMPGLLQALSVHRLRAAQAMSFTDALLKSVRHRALPAWLFGLLGASGLVMIGAGMLGLLAMSVSHRTKEVGIRLALGSTGGGIVRLLVAEQMRPVAAGLAAGAVVAVWAVRLLESQLYGVEAHDPRIWALVAATVFATALAGALVPSLRSAAANPLDALRAE
jgi:predicted permease